MPDLSAIGFAKDMQVECLFGGIAKGSVTRRQSALWTGITSGN